MSTELLEINLNKETNFDFELSITGISANTAKVRFGVELPAFTLQVPCTRGDDKTWSVTLPKFEDCVEEGQYTFTIELIVDGYYFAPVKGTAKIAPVAEISGTIPRKGVEVAVTSITPKKTIIKDEVDEEPKKKKTTKTKKTTEKGKKEVKKEVNEEVNTPSDEEDNESVVDKMIEKRFEPFENGKSILSQMTELTNNKQKEPPLTEQQKKVRAILEEHNASKTLT